MTDKDTSPKSNSNVGKEHMELLIKTMIEGMRSAADISDTAEKNERISHITQKLESMMK